MMTPAAVAGKAFLAEKAALPDVFTLSSGLLFKVLRRGPATGRSPTAATPCSVHYEGTLMDGACFGSSYHRNKPEKFSPGQVIPGWTEALQIMCEGDVWLLYIPYQLAYGPSGAGADIPGYSALVFKVELVGLTSSGGGKAASAAADRAAESLSREDAARFRALAEGEHGTYDVAARPMPPVDERPPEPALSATSVILLLLVCCGAAIYHDTYHNPENVEDPVEE